MTDLTTVLGLAALAGGIWWLARRAARGGGSTRRDDIDYETLREAEDEVRDLDALATPDDAAQDLPDWGPGAPRG